jgi:hypothetical protein
MIELEGKRRGSKRATIYKNISDGTRNKFGGRGVWGVVKRRNTRNERRRRKVFDSLGG